MSLLLICRKKLAVPQTIRLVRFYPSFLVTGVGLALSFIYGLNETGNWMGAFNALFLTFVLALLEISLSVDNAVVNATVLRKMNAKWQKYFVTWGMLISVVGMRLIFPLVVVSVVAGISPWRALHMALFSQDRYAQTMLAAHFKLTGFGAAFLFLAFLNYFLDRKKNEHWWNRGEKVLVRLGRIPLVKTLLFSAVFLYCSSLLPAPEQTSFLIAAFSGMAVHFVLQILTELVHLPSTAFSSSALAFFYLEILDSSFSLDGVIGGFALTHSLIILALGLGIGAMYVRSLTLWLVERKALNEFRYLEHGAFYAIGALAGLMLVDLRWPVPEAVTGAAGLLILGLSVWSSLRKPQARAI